MKNLLFVNPDQTTLTIAVGSDFPEPQTGDQVVINGTSQEVIKRTLHIEENANTIPSVKSVSTRWEYHIQPSGISE